jgi:hypothetical protein
MAQFLRLLLLALWSTAAFPQATVEAGTIVKPSRDVSVPAAITDKLSGVAEIRAFVSLPNHDAVVVSDSIRDKPGTTDFMDNHPHIALLRRGVVALNVDVLNLAPAGPVRFHGMAVLPGSEIDAAAAFAFTLGVDGSGTFFVFVGRRNASYKVTATLTGAQAQLRFGAKGSQLEFWSADRQHHRNPLEQCVWCPKYYKKIVLAWRNGKLLRVGALTSSRSFQPEDFFAAPFALLR